MAEKTEAVVERTGLRANALLKWATLASGALAGLTAVAIVAAYAAYSIERQSAVGLGDVPAALLNAVPFAILAKLGQRASQHAAAMPGSANPRAALTSARELVGVSIVPLFFGFVLSIGLGFLSVSDLSGLTPLVVHLAQAAVLLCVPVELATMVVAAVARAPRPAA